MPWIMEVRIEVDATKPIDSGRYEWKAVRPTGGQPYHFATQAEAARMLQICYSECTRDEVRIREVEP